jgi:hypothetical protein
VRKQDPRDLYELTGEVPSLDGPVLLQALDGYVDAGSAKRLAREQLLTVHGAQPVAVFDVTRCSTTAPRGPR